MVLEFNFLGGQRLRFSYTILLIVSYAGSGQWPICNYRKVVNLFTLTVNASINRDSVYHQPGVSVKYWSLKVQSKVKIR